MKINTYLTKVNFNTLKNKVNKYIVVHYTGNNGDTALGNCKYFYDVNRNASAHYFVDENNIYQCVKDNDVAWHCGASTYKHPYCRNNNSIGVELCSRKSTNYYFMNETVDNAVELVRELMAKYNIPVENVIRHYDVTGKICPEPYVRDSKAWQNFKARLATVEVKEDDEVVSEGKAIVNGKEYKIDRILKDNANFIKVSNFSNMGFDVGYDADTKAVVINNKVNELSINAEGLDVSVKAVNIEGYNYVNLRDIAKAIDREVDVIDGKIYCK